MILLLKAPNTFGLSEYSKTKCAERSDSVDRVLDWGSKGS